MLLKILGLITARGGSKGIPGKNIKMLGDKPLLGYVAQDALNAKLLSKVVISTDSEEIAEIAKQFGVEVPFLRPTHLALDNTPSWQVVEHVIDYYESRNEYFDAVCLLQPTSPFKPTGFIDKAIELFINAQPDTLISVMKVPHVYNPHWVFEKTENDFLKISTGDDTIITRRQDLPNAFYRDGSVYLFRTSFFRKNKVLVGGKTAFIESDPDYYCNLDTMEDWENAQKTIKLIHF